MSKRTKIMVFGVDGVVGRQCALRLFERGYHIMAVGAAQPPGQGEGIWQRVPWASWPVVMEGCAAVVNALAHTKMAQRWSVEDAAKRTGAILSKANALGIRRVIFVSHRVTLGAWERDALDSADHHVPGDDVPIWVEALHIAEAMHKRAVVDELDCLTLVPAWCVADLAMLKAHVQPGEIASDVQVHVTTPHYISSLVMSALERGQAGRRYVCPGAAGTWGQLIDRIWGDMDTPRGREFGRRLRARLPGQWRAAPVNALDARWVVGPMEGSWAEGSLGVQGQQWEACFDGF